MDKTILLHAFTDEEFYNKLREIIRQEIKSALLQDQLLTKEGAMKLIGISSGAFNKAVADGALKPQLIKGRKKAMYLETEVLRIETKKRRSTL